MTDFPEDLSENPTIDSLKKLIGPELFGRLSAELGGRRLYFPHKPGPNTPLVVCIGLDAAQKISHVYAGLEFDVPVRAGVRHRILELRAKGVKKARIAPELGISRRMVYKVFAEEDAKSQMDLFS